MNESANHDSPRSAAAWERINQPASHLVLHWPLGVIILIYVAVAAAHSIIAPLTIGNDEYPHFLYTRFIAEHGRLPTTVAERSNKDEVGTKSDDPPLYHLISAAAAFWVEPTRLLKPVEGQPRRQLADNVVVSHSFLAHIGHELWPYQGEVLLWHVGRGVSIFFGMMAIILTYVTGLMVLGNRWLALSAAAVLAFMPAFIFHTSVMSYDSLGAVFTALFLIAGLKVVQQPKKWRWWIMMGALAGLAITTKYTSVLLPAEIVFLVWLSFWNQSGRIEAARVKIRVAIPRLVVAGLALLIASSWWFGFIVWNFNTIGQNGPVVGILEPLLVRGGNDSTAIRVTSFLFGQAPLNVDSPPPARQRDYPHLVWTLFQSFWAAPVAEKFVLPNWLTPVFSLGALLAVPGWWRLWRQGDALTRRRLLLLFFHTCLVLPLILARLFLSYDPLEAVQGRHILLPAASAIAVLLVWGWQQINRKIGRWFAVGLLLWSVLGQVAWAALRYPPPMPVWSVSTDLPAEDTPPAQITVKTGVPGMKLTGVAWQVTDAPAIQVDLWWQTEAIMSQDYLIELTLLDEAGNLISYGAGQPVQGRYPTRAWEMSELIKDVHYLPLVDQVPGRYSLVLRLLNIQAQPIEGLTPITLGQIDVPAVTSRVQSCPIWFQGRPRENGILTLPYRLRSAFTVISSDGQPVLKPIQADAPPQIPLISRGKFHIFMVGPDWKQRYQLMAGMVPCAEIAVEVPARQFSLPHSFQELQIDFNREIRLLGYDLSTRRINPDGRLPVTLYWQALGYMGDDYRLFDNLLDADQQRWGGYDRRARDGYSTLLWTPGEVITDAFGIPIDSDAPPGIYTLDIGWYQETGQGAKSLPLTVDEQSTEQTSVRLGPVKVGGPPPDVVTQNPQPQVTLNQFFGDQITLLGYDIRKSEIPLRSASGTIVENLKFTFYWRADRIPAADYTVFLHLRNAANENVAQQDSPPAAGRYPTSLWDAGEIIVDDLTLLVADVPPGEYTPVVGLYNFIDGARLPVPGVPGNEVALPLVRIVNGEE